MTSPNKRVQRTRLCSPLTRRPLGRVSLGALLCAWVLIGCSSGTRGFRTPETWRIYLWSGDGQFLGSVLVELTGRRAGIGPAPPVGRVEDGLVLENSASSVPGIGHEAELRIDGKKFIMDLNHGMEHNNLFVTGTLNGDRASGEANFFAVLGRQVGRFEAKRI